MTARTPQRINGRRIILSKAGRQAHVQNELLAAHAALDAHLSTVAAGATIPTAAAALAAAKTQLGKPYCLAGCRCSPGCPCRDCSGEVVYGVNQAGLAFPCTSSFGIAAFCRDHGTLIPMAQAIVTPGAIGIRNPWGSPSWNGANGHVWYCLGDGLHTVEEGGHATGCYIGSVFDKGSPVVWALFPGLDYTIRTEDTMQLIASPHKPTIAGRQAAAVWDPAHPNQVSLTNGASISGDDQGTHVWTPGNPQGTTGIGIMAEIKRDGTPTGKGIVFQDDKGDTYTGRWS